MVMIPLMHKQLLEQVSLNTLQERMPCPVLRSTKVQVPLPLQSLGHLMMIIVMMIVIMKVTIIE